MPYFYSEVNESGIAERTHLQVQASMQHLFYQEEAISYYISHLNIQYSIQSLHCNLPPTVQKCTFSIHNGCDKTYENSLLVRNPQCALIQYSTTQQPLESVNGNWQVESNVGAKQEHENDAFAARSHDFHDDDSARASCIYRVT